MGDYPGVAIMVGVVVAFAAATLFAGGLAKAGFPLPGGERASGIDGLRGYLAMSVMAHHFIMWFQIDRLGADWTLMKVNFFANMGGGGVALFFMTTGFVFYPRVLMGFRATPWMQIYTSRVFRILPLVLFSFTVISGVVVWRTGRSPDGEFLKTAVQWVTGWDEPPLLGLADSGRINAYVLWSLWMEWLFYLVALPVCAAAMDVVRGRLPSFVLPVGFAGVGLGMRFFHIGGEMPKYMHLFALGMLAYEAQRHEAVIRVMRGRIAAVIAVAILGAAMSSVRVPYGFLQSGFYGVFFVCVACGNDIFGVLRTKGAQVLGECSFGIYLLHGVVLSLLFVEGESLLRHLSSSVLPTLLPMVFVGVVGVAGITFLLIEGPAIRFGKKLVRWRGRLLRMA